MYYYYVAGGGRQNSQVLPQVDTFGRSISQLVSILDSHVGDIAKFSVAGTTSDATSLIEVGMYSRVNVIST